jgi:O-antigen/teichoic acid export membrane protein
LPENPSSTSETGAATVRRARSLHALVLSGLAWSLGTSFFLQILRVGFAVTLARFLTPHEYGLAAMALVFSVLVLAFSDLSLGVGLVQRKVISEDDRSTVFWTSVGVGLLLTVVGIGLSGPIASFFGEPAVQPLFAVLSLSFVVGSLGATHAALLHRAMNFRSISIRVTISTIVGGVVGVSLAVTGYGAWSLIAQQLVMALISTALLWMSIPWRPRLMYSRRSLLDLGSFGGRILGVRVLDYLRLNGDKVLVGRFLGSAPLGTYTVAFNIVLMPLSRLFIAVADTMLPALSQLQDDRERMANAWLRVNRAVSGVFAPALLGLIIVAPDFVLVLLGDRWRDVAPLLQILSVGVIALGITALGVQVLTALDRATTLLRFSMAETVILIAAVAVGLRWGVMGVAAAYVVASVATRMCFAGLVTRSLGIPFARYVASLAGVAQASIALVIATLGARIALVEVGAPAWLRLSAVVAVGIAVYVPLCLWRVPDFRTELRRIRREGLGRGALSVAR